MLKPKTIVISSVSGLVLSFLISIISTHNFGWSLLRALIFAVIFGGLSVGISFLNEKFLATDDSSSFSEEQKEGQSTSAPVTGSKVDITIDDERLTDDGDGPKFDVAGNTMALGGGTKVSLSSSVESTSPMENVASPIENAASPIENTASPDAETAFVQAEASQEDDMDPLKPKKEPFKPIELGVPVAESSVEETSTAKAPSQVMAEQNKASAEVSEKKLASKELSQAERIAQRAAERAADMKEIDSLPDIGDAPIDSSDEVVGDIIKDSEFAESGTVDAEEDKRISMVDGSKAKDHDTETMAKAIRTLLKREE